MTIKELKTIFTELLENLEQYKDDEQVKMVSNTYFLGYPSIYLAIAGSHGGFINLDNPTGKEDDEQ